MSQQDKAMKSEISTAVSDAVLALSALNAAYMVLDVSFSAVLGFSMVAAAAGCGTIRFALPDPGSELIAWHKYLTWLVGATGLPFIAAGYSRKANVTIVANALLAVGLALALLKKYLSTSVQRVLPTVNGGASVLSILLLCLAQFNEYGIIGAILYIIAPIVVKTEGEMAGLQRVDVFHVVLVLGNVAFMLGLCKEATPMYYRPAS